jgi:malonyl-CoA O-methyltransferase
MRRQRNGNHLQEVDPRPGYDIWAATYDADAPGNPVLNAERSALEARLPALNDQAVLDLACGTGHYALHAARAGARLAVGVDLSAGMLRCAQAKAASEGLPVTLVQADQAHVPLADSAFDVAIHALGAGYTPDVRPVAAGLGRVLRPDGLALASDLHPQGVQRGWRRTFSAPEGRETTRWPAVATLKAYPHQMEDYRAAFEQAGLSITHLLEPRIDERLRPAFAAANALERYEQAHGLPLLVIFELRQSRLAGRRLSGRRSCQESHAD